MHVQGLSPVKRYVRTLGDFYLISEVAEALGVSEWRLRGLADTDPKLGPSARADWAGGDVLLYTPADVARLHEHLRAAQRKSRRLWTVAEYHDRQRRERMARYWRRKVTKALAAGDTRTADTARIKARRLARQLEIERVRRVEKKKARTTGGSAARSESAAAGCRR